MSKTFQEACGFKLGDDLCISAAGQLSVVENVVLRDVTANEEGTPELGEADRPHWEWFLRESLSRSFFSHVVELSDLDKPRSILIFKMFECPSGIQTMRPSAYSVRKGMQVVQS